MLQSANSLKRNLKLNEINYMKMIEFQCNDKAFCSRYQPFTAHTISIIPFWVIWRIECHFIQIHPILTIIICNESNVINFSLLPGKSFRNFNHSMSLPILWIKALNPLLAIVDLDWHFTNIWLPGTDTLVCLWIPVKFLTRSAYSLPPL